MEKRKLPEGEDYGDVSESDCDNGSSGSENDVVVNVVEGSGSLEYDKNNVTLATLHGCGREPFTNHLVKRVQLCLSLRSMI